MCGELNSIRYRREAGIEKFGNSVEDWWMNEENVEYEEAKKNRWPRLLIVFLKEGRTFKAWNLLVEEVQFLDAAMAPSIEIMRTLVSEKPAICGMRTGRMYG